MFFRVMKAWVPLVVVATCACALAYVGCQQVYRMSANDPQTQLAEDRAAALAGGTPLASMTWTGTVDVATSLAPWEVVYDSTGRPVAGTGRMFSPDVSAEGTLATPPRGVLEAASAKGRDSVTWQPRPGVRIAIVAVPVSAGPGGWVVAGRSLREVEVREDDLLKLAAAAWLAALAGSLAAVWAFQWAEERLALGSRK